MRYGCSRPGALLFCSQARHWFTQPVSNGASTTASASSVNWAAMPAAEIIGPSFRAHLTNSSSTSRVAKLYIR